MSPAASSPSVLAGPSRGGLIWLLPALLVLLALAVALLNTPVHPHDDLRDIGRFYAQPPAAAFTTPWLCDDCGMYRPVLALAMKSLAELSGFNSLGLRGPVLLLVLAFLAVCLAIFRRSTDDPALLGLGLIYLLGSPFVFHPFTYWGNMSALIVIGCFALCYLLMISEWPAPRVCAAMSLLFALSLFTSELGLANVVFVLHFLRRRQIGPAAVFLLPLAVYLAARVAVTGGLAGPPLLTDSGFLFEMLSSEEIAARFPGVEIYGFNLYTAATQVVAVFTRLFKNGVFHFSEKLIPFALGLLVILPYLARRLTQPGEERWRLLVLLLAIGLCAFLSHKYARDRNMAMGSVAYAVILVLAFADLKRRGPKLARLATPLAAVLIAGWLLLAVNNVKNLHQETRRFQAFLETHAVYPNDDVSPDVYRQARENYLKLF